MNKNSFFLIHARKNLPSHNRLVLFPVSAVLLGASDVVSALAVDEKDSKVERVEAGEKHAPALGNALHDLGAVKHSVAKHIRGGHGALGQNHVASEARGQTERQRLHPVAKVVDVARHAPPARGQESGATLGLQVGQAGDAGVVGGLAEDGLLGVGCTEDVQADGKRGGEGSNARPAEVSGIDGEVAALRRVNEGNPDNIAESKHEAETVGDDIHHAENTSLGILALEDVVALDSRDENHTVGNVAVVAVLLGDKGEIQQKPASQTGAHLQPSLDVNLSKDGEVDAGVELAANIKVINQVSGVAALGKLTKLAVASLDREASSINVNGNSPGKDNVGGEELQVVFVHPSPDDEIGAVDVSADSASCDLDKSR